MADLRAAVEELKDELTSGRLKIAALPATLGPVVAGRLTVATGRTSVRYLDLATRRTMEVAPVDSRVDLGLALSPDGKHLLFTKIDHLGADLMLVEQFR